MSVFGLKEIMLNSATAFNFKSLCWDRHYDLEKTRADWPDEPNVALPLVDGVTSRHS